MDLRVAAVYTDGYNTAPEGVMLIHFRLDRETSQHTALRYIEETIKQYAATLTEDGDAHRDMIAMHGWNWGDVVDHIPPSYLREHGIWIISVTSPDAVVDHDVTLIESDDLPILEDENEPIGITCACGRVLLRVDIYGVDEAICAWCEKRHRLSEPADAARLTGYASL